MDKLQLRSNDHHDILDITKLIADIISTRRFQEGLCYIFTPHTTCAVTTADLDPGTAQDYALAADSLLKGVTFNHPHNPEHFPAHFLGAVVGPSLAVPVSQGELQIGEWQRIVLMEFDGPKNRSISVSFLSTNKAEPESSAT